MTLGNFLSQMGIGTKHLSERYSQGEYVAPAHDTHLHYTYEPTPSHGHIVASSKHHHGGGGHKSNAAMSALTLLSFLFFLHILQQCLRDHMTTMTTPPVMIMTAGREGEEVISKTSVANKADKSGTINIEEKQYAEIKGYGKMNAENISFDDGVATADDLFTKIKTSEYTPKMRGQIHKDMFKTYGNRSITNKGFVSAIYGE